MAFKRTILAILASLILQGCFTLSLSFETRIAVGFERKAPALPNPKGYSK